MNVVVYRREELLSKALRMKEVVVVVVHREEHQLKAATPCHLAEFNGPTTKGPIEIILARMSLDPMGMLLVVQTTPIGFLTQMKALRPF